MNGEAKNWKAVTDKIVSLHKNSKWKLIDLLKGKNAIGCKWVLTKKMILFGKESDTELN